MIAKEIENLSKILAKLPSMGYRSSRRAVLKMLEKKEQLLFPLIDALENLKQNVKTCELCGKF
jgi:recombination protein RecR